ncbi:DUF2474 family protein [Aromatoleum sp.]|uniref:DUF2474 family protein n=1 Tax=Aromatoleum sp. TaxID=2307007 RepID=UPI002FCC5A9E
MPDDGNAARQPAAGAWAKRLGWLAGLWAAGVVTLGAVTLLLRLLARWAGLAA